MMSMSDVCEVYFKGKVKPKDLREFEETTPDGNLIKGYINTKPNKYLGSMLISTVNNEVTNQFIQSMPKIHYYNHHTDISYMENLISFCYEKLDGTCLILYPLKNTKGDTIEIVPKTRGRAVADQHFTTLYHRIDRKPIQDYYKENDGILIFELYGILNQHDIIYYNTGIDIRLISIYTEEKGFQNNKGVADKFNFKLPDCIFAFYFDGNEFILESNTKKFKSYLPVEKHRLSYQNTDDLINGIKEQLENLNKDYSEVNNRIAVEGVVINTRNFKGEMKWLKCKPSDIELKHRSEKGIPKKIITKEVLKYFDEYGSQVHEIYRTDKNHHTEYIHRMLREEYDEVFIQKSKKKIEKIFMKIWESREIPQSIHTICDNLIKENPNSSIQDLMRIFSNEYPMKKKDARLVYSTLSVKMKQQK